MVLSPISACGLCATADHCGHIIIKHRSTSNTEIAIGLAYASGIVLHGGLLGAWIGMCLDNTQRERCL